MTLCVKGPWSHQFPVEDATGAYCERHGITLPFHPARPLPEYLDDGLVRPEPPAATTVDDRSPLPQEDHL